MLNKRTIFVTLTLIAVSSSVAAVGFMSADDCLRLSEHPGAWQKVNDEWRTGSIVALVRHTTDCEPETVEGCINGNEFLTTVGEQQAQEIGWGFQTRLGGRRDVGHSRLDRTTSTALLAFGASEEDPFVTKPCKGTIQPYVESQPSGVNRVFVTHSSCINSFKRPDGSRALGFSAAKDRNFGIVAFFRNRDNRPDELLGCVWPSDWAALPVMHDTRFVAN